MNHDAYLAWRARLRAERTDLLDLGELNVYRSLAPAFARIAPSLDREAPHRCHLAERYLDRLGLDRSLAPRALISHGVRRSLAALFALLARAEARVGIPVDVYPTYLTLAREAGLAIVPYCAHDGLPDLDRVDALLVCDPRKPWGGDVDLEAAFAWARARPSRRVIVDSVYATPPRAAVLEAAARGEIVLLTSISKGWLTPDHLGLCLVPEDLVRDARDPFSRLDKDESKLRIGFAALTEHTDRPLEVRAHLATLAAHLDAITRARPELAAAPSDGYFAISTRSAESLLALGVIAAPASVFGGPQDLSILSSLPPAR